MKIRNPRVVQFRCILRAVVPGCFLSVWVFGTPAEPDASIAGYPENRRKYFFQGIEHVFARDVVNAMSLVGFDFDAASPQSIPLLAGEESHL